MKIGRFLHSYKISILYLFYIILVVSIGLTLFFWFQEVPMWASGVYFLYLFCVVLLPGFVLGRLLGNSFTSSLILAYPFGILGELLLYPLMKALNLDTFYIVAYVGIFLVCLYIIRKRKLFPEKIQISPYDILGITVCVGLVLLYMSRFFLTTHLLPTSFRYVKYYFDYTWTMGNTAAMLLEFPPDYIHAAGLTTFKYHYFLNIHMASLTKITHLPFIYSFLRFYPVVPFLLICLIIFFAIRERTKSIWGALLAVVCSFFITGFEFNQDIYTNYFAHIYYSPTTYFFSLIFFIPLVLEIGDLFEGDTSWSKRLNIILLSLCLLGSKGNALSVVIAGAGIVLILSIGKIRRTEWRMIAGLTILFTLVTYILFTSFYKDFSTQFVSSYSIATFKKAILYNLSRSSIYDYFSGIHYSFVRNFIVFIVYFVSLLGVKAIIWFMGILHWRQPLFSSEGFLWFSIPLSFFGMFLFAMPGMSQVYYGFYAIQLSALYIGIVTPRLFHLPTVNKWAMGVGLGTLLILSTFSLNRYFTPSFSKPNPQTFTHSSMSNLQYEAFQFIEKNLPKNILMLNNRLYYESFKVRRSYVYLTAFSQRKAFLEGTGWLYPSLEVKKPIDHRYADVEAFFTGKVTDCKKFLKDRGITHIVFDKQIDYYNQISCKELLNLIYSNSDVDVYEVKY